MIKVTVTIDEGQDQSIKDLQIKKAKVGVIVNYSKAMRLVLDEGFKKF